MYSIFRHSARLLSSVPFISSRWVIFSEVGEPTDIYTDYDRRTQSRKSPQHPAYKYNLEAKSFAAWPLKYLDLRH